MDNAMTAPIPTLRWEGRRLYILDQTLLPTQEQMVALDDLESVFEAIRSLRVRGAPAIGLCAAYGVLVGVKAYQNEALAVFRRRAEQCISRLAESRPTAVNLFYALERMREVLHGFPESGSSVDCFTALEAEAEAQYAADLAMCQEIGRYGAKLIREGMGILTHCNAGGLATSGLGTALAPLYVAHHQGLKFRVYADETRPLLQGARLTSWELERAGIDVTLICDNMAASLMRARRIDAVIVGADRIAANGDTANKIGTYGVAALATMHNIPVYVAAPWNTFDPHTAYGEEIPIEERYADEVRTFMGVQAAPPTVAVYNPAFDVTPATLIAAFITDRGILFPPFEESIATMLSTLYIPMGVQENHHDG